MSNRPSRSTTTTTPHGLSTAWERGKRRSAWVLSGLILVPLAIAAIALHGVVPAWFTLPAVLLISFLVHRGVMAPVRRRTRILAEPFPTAWNIVLQKEVAFFRALSPPEQQRFRRELQVFLGEKSVVGAGFELDTTTHVLVAASAVIPIFGFPDWEWDQIREVVVRTQAFDGDFDGEGDANVLGMVGTGYMNGMMVLSRADLLSGFRNSGDKRNVGIHEFAHLVDKSDGQIDGLPGVGLDRQSIGPWVEIVRQKMADMSDGKAKDIDSYGLTNEAEFFAVVTEHFFERPGALQRNHPQLYSLLTKVFRQDTRSRLRQLRKRDSKRKPLGRNSPCPCGSGKKFKRCCLAKT